MLPVIPPISICPEAPMLKRPVLNANATESPIRISCVDIPSVFPILLTFERAPKRILSNPAIGFFPIRAMRIAPAIIPRNTAERLTRRGDVFLASSGLLITLDFTSLLLLDSCHHESDSMLIGILGIHDIDQASCVHYRNSV